MIPRLLAPEELPEPFKTYWTSGDALKRPFWRFYLYNDELYIEDTGDEDRRGLLEHWTLASCCGVLVFMRDNAIEPKRMPYVTTTGVTLFEVLSCSDYETSIRDPKSGATWVVHSG